eukprot:jgi/Ulvmu1/124/UM001_0128.1
MRGESAFVADEAAAQTTSWDEFIRTGCAEGEYLYLSEPADEAVKNIKSDEFHIAAFAWNLSLFPRSSTHGTVGLKNQGSTCCMDLLLQTLYHIPQFRRAVYDMPTAEGEDPEVSIPLALKHLFYKLEHTQIPGSTK